MFHLAGAPTARPLPALGSPPTPPLLKYIPGADLWGSAADHSGRIVMWGAGFYPICSGRDPLPIPHSHLYLLTSLSSPVGYLSGPWKTMEAAAQPQASKGKPASLSPHLLPFPP